MTKKDWVQAVFVFFLIIPIILTFGLVGMLIGLCAEIFKKGLNAGRWVLYFSIDDLDEYK